MGIAEKRSYIITIFGFFSWIIISLTNYLFSFIFDVPFEFSMIKLVFIPFKIQFLTLTFIKFRIFRFLSTKEKKVFLYTQLFFVLINGLYATYICITQNDAYNGFSVLFTYLIGLVFLNRFLGLKGTVLSSILFFFIFYVFLTSLDVSFGKDEGLLCYFFGYSGIIFGFFSLLFSISLIIYALYIKFQGLAVPGSTSIIITISFFSGILLLTIGIVGIYKARIFEQTKGRDQYVIKNIKNFK